MRASLPFILVLILHSTLSAATINVPYDYPTIQLAIDAAANGDTVLVDPGTYVENIDFLGKAIIVKGAGGPDATFIDGSNPANPDEGSVVNFRNGEGPDSVLEGFTLFNGTGTKYSLNLYGGGVFCNDASPTVKNNHIMSNTADYGGGIYGDTAFTALENIIQGNSAAASGGGVHASGSVIEKNVIKGNTAVYGGGGVYGSGKIRYNDIIQNSCGTGAGVYCFDNTNVNGNVISNNKGTGVEFAASKPTIFNNTIANNKGHGISTTVGWKIPQIAGNLICGNKNSGIYSNKSEPLVVNNTIYGNNEHGILFDADAESHVVNSIIRGNGGAQIAGSMYYLKVTYSNIQGGWPGAGNINKNPLFVDPASGDYHLSFTSPCLDAGDNGSVPVFLTKDFDKEDRIAEGDGGGDTIVDMGCDELVPFLVPDDYPTIQSAIDNVDEGDAILVSPGTYMENITFRGKALKVFGRHGPAGVVIDGGQTGSVVTFDQEGDAGSMLEGFTIVNGKGDDQPAFTGGGITCMGSSPLIRRNIIKDNRTPYSGAGICCSDGASPRIKYNEIGNNRADFYGAGIFCFFATPKIKYNELHHNDCPELGGLGGAIACWEAPCEIDGNVLYSNHVKNYGGGICCWYSSALIVNNVLHSNEAMNFGGGLCVLHSSPAITNNTFYGNSSDTIGGGLYCGDEVVTVANSIFWGNQAPVNPEIQGTNVTVTYSDVKGGWPGTGNIDADPGFVDPVFGDFHLASGSPCLDRGDNAAPQLPIMDMDEDPRIVYGVADMGADEMNGSRLWKVPGDFSTIQDAIDFAIDQDTILVGSGTYHENIDYKKKAITVKSSHGPEATVIQPVIQEPVVTLPFAYEGDTAVLEGFTVRNGTKGGIHSQWPRTVIRNNIISANTGGSGIHCSKCDWLLIDGNIITGNSSSCGGGIIVYESYGEIFGNVIADNTADWRGGGVYCNTTQPADYEILVINNIITHNSAASDGGGISCFKFPSVKIVNNTIVENTAAGLGGGYHCEFECDCEMVNSILWGNNAPQGAQIALEASSNPPNILTVSYSDVEGGKTAVYLSGLCDLNWGAGMIDGDPAFVDQAVEDFHLSFTSPCKDGGDNSAADLPVLDMEGDPRIAYGDVDMGADEFHTHLYWTGDAQPGGTVEVKLVDTPGTTPLGLCIGSGVLEDPLATSWGEWWLMFPIVGPIDLGVIPVPGGVLIIQASIPSYPPGPYDLPMQAIQGSKLTNLSVLTVR